MKKLMQHLRAYILRGILVSIPIGLSFFVIRLFYVTIDRRIINYVDEIIGFRIPGLGIVIVLISLYLIGYLTSNIIGKRCLDAGCGSGRSSNASASSPAGHGWQENHSPHALAVFPTTKAGPRFPATGS